MDLREKKTKRAIKDAFLQLRAKKAAEKNHRKETLRARRDPKHCREFMKQNQDHSR